MSRLRIALIALLSALLIAILGFTAWVRIAPDNPGVWNVDPATITETGSDNAWLVKPAGEVADAVSPVFAEAQQALLTRFRDMALAEPRVTVLTDIDEGLTLIQRSEVMAYPDYISVRAVPVEGGAALMIWSRSRYGESDFGVNRERISAWLAKL